MLIVSTVIVNRKVKLRKLATTRMIDGKAMRKRRVVRIIFDPLRVEKCL